MTVLGCSPGTRSFGIAILKDGMLIDWEVFTSRGKRSKEKLHGILEKIEIILYAYGIDKVAIKVPDVFPTTTGYNQLIGGLNTLLEKNGTHSHYFTFSELKEQCPPNVDATKKDIAEYVAKKYPELRSRIRSSSGLPSFHYFKLFEAVCVTTMLRHKLILSKAIR